MDDLSENKNKETLDVFVGSQSLTVSDVDEGISFPVFIHYPTLEPSIPTAFGPYTMEVSENASIHEGRFPLVVISHGNGGSPLLYRTISTYLAKRGYIVAMLEHYGNNRNNNSLENSLENLILRPRHVSLTIDTLLSDSNFRDFIIESRIAGIGHSMGGYTALALAGGIPRTKEAQNVEVNSDCRVKAIVLLAPGAGWFIQGLDHVNLPILMLSAEHDPVTPAWNADVVLNGVPDKSLVTFEMIKQAGHFSFLSPFPDHLKHPNFLPSTDPPGFDREKFHQELPQIILNFFNRYSI